MQRDEVDLRCEVESAVEQMGALADSCACQVTLNLWDGPAPILGEPARLRQLVHILLSNALEHGGSEVSVTVSLGPVPEGWELSVRDDGPGIPVEEERAVFERFYRGARSARKDSNAGTGLGLPIAQSIVIAHGGRIWSERPKGGGAWLRIILPGLDENHQVAGVRTAGS